MDDTRIDPNRTIPLLLLTLVSMAFIVTLPHLGTLWAGYPAPGVEEGFGLRLMREGTLVVIIGAVAADRRFWNVVLSKNVLIVLLLIAAYSCFEVVRALLLDLPLIVPLTGLRVFQYLPIALIGLMIARMEGDGEVLARFARYLCFFVLIQGVLAVPQVLWGPPIHGESVFGGGRAFGSFVAPNLFGACIASCALVLSVADRRALRKWIYFSVVLCVLSGSRAAMMCACLIICSQIWSAFRAQERVLMALFAPALAVGALVLLSSELFTGRADSDLASEGRLMLWREMLGANLNDATDLLLGWGLGLGSNTINTVFGPDYWPGQFDSDSLYLFILNGYGLIGLMLYLGLLAATLYISGHKQKLLVVAFIFMAGLPFNMWEYFPQNVMLMLLWGYVLGKPHVVNDSVPGPTPAAITSSRSHDGAAQPALT